MSSNISTGTDYVPEMSQLLVLPFLSAVAGSISSVAKGAGYRLTFHRTMCRHDEIYLQQMVDYFSSDPLARKGSGRVFAVDTGIIGGAFRSRKVHHTKHFDDLDQLRSALAEDLGNTEKSVEEVPYSYLAIPFLGTSDAVEPPESPQELTLAVLYAECFKMNIFAEENLLTMLVEQSREFAATMDRLVDVPLEHVKNFPILLRGKTLKLVGDEPFSNLNRQPDEKFLPPKFNSVDSFNFEFSQSL